MHINIHQDSHYIRVSGTRDELRALGQMLVGLADMPGISCKTSFVLPDNRRDKFPPMPEITIERVGQ